MPEISELSRDELEAYAKELEEQAQNSRGYTRRSVIAAAAGIAGAGTLGLYSTGLASAAPSGTFPESTDDPLLKIRADNIKFIPRSSDPSSPDGGTMWVVE